MQVNVGPERERERAETILFTEHVFFLLYFPSFIPNVLAGRSYGITKSGKG
jgi:hypothetical protein